METNRTILIGGGQHAQVVLDCLLASGVDVVAIFDPAKSGSLFGVSFRGDYNPSFDVYARAVVAIGDNATRKRASAEVSHAFTNAIHHSVIFSPFASVGVGNMVLHGAIVQALAKIGNHTIINTGARVDHDCVIGDFVHIAPGAVLCGSVTVGEGSMIGAGATVAPGRRIGNWAIIGAGAVVVEDVPDNAVVVGNPGRIKRYTTVK
ncbi:acetyltransferase [Chryseolinea sp. T2]|uniref:acetyltransferase n=1 Tax=Chryseolinea sp. T2 TaxID=3129255 RepID=UPI003078107F